MINAVFFGTPDFSKKFLNILHDDEEIFISSVITQPDKPVGRKKVLTSPPTAEYAIEQSIPLLQPETLKGNDELVQTLKTLQPDIFIIIAYGKIIPEEILAIPKMGSINVHPSLLPKYRGPSPLQTAIANQDEETGVSIMLIDEKMDHGPILSQVSMTIEPDDTYEAMLEKTVKVASSPLVVAIKGFLSGDIHPTPQDHESATFCKMMTKEDGNIDWNMTAEEIYARFRAFHAWPGIYTFWNGKRLKLHDITIPKEAIEMLSPGIVRCLEDRLFIGTGSVTMEVKELQPEGRPSMTAKSFIQGNAQIDTAKL